MRQRDFIKILLFLLLLSAMYMQDYFPILTMVHAQNQVNTNYGTLIVNTDAPAKVTIEDSNYDDKELGMTPVNINLKTGNYQLDIDAVDLKHNDIKWQSITIKDGSTTSVYYRLLGDDVWKSRDLNKVSIECDEPYNLYIEGKFAGKSPLNLLINDGTYAIRLESINDKNKAFETKMLVNFDSNFKYSLVYMPKYKVTVTSNVPAHIYINDVLYGGTPQIIELTAGSYTIRLSAPGYKDEKAIIKVEKDVILQYNLKKEKIEVHLALDANVEADVYINDEFYGTTPLEISLEPNKYKLRLESKGYKTLKTTISLDKDTEYSYELKPDMSDLKISFITNVPSEVYINNVFFGNTPLEVSLQLGSYKLRLEAEGYQPYTTTLTVGKSEIFSFKLFKNNKIPEVTINANVLSKVYINDLYVGDTPLKTSLTPGKYTIRLEASGYDSISTSIAVNKNQTYTFKLKKYTGSSAFVYFKIPESAILYINNKQHEFDTAKPMLLPPGLYSIKIVFGETELQYKLRFESAMTYTINVGLDLQIDIE